MQRTTKNRKFILGYYTAISGVKKTRELICHFVSDAKLIEHVLFFEKMFPAFEVILDEITTEDDRVIVQGRRRGKLSSQMEGRLAGEKAIEIPFAMGFRIEDPKIVDHWFISDQMELLEQLVG